MTRYADLLLRSHPGQIRTERSRHNLRVAIGPHQQRSVGVDDRVQNVVGAWAGHRQTVEQHLPRQRLAVSFRQYFANPDRAHGAEEDCTDVPVYCGGPPAIYGSGNANPGQVGPDLLAVLDLGVAHPLPKTVAL